MENKKNRERYIVVLLILNLLISVGTVVYLACEKAQKADDDLYFQAQETQTGEKYLLYIGLNDKDTYRQEKSTDEARDIIDSICVKYTDGYTVFEATGGWTDETDAFTSENTLVYAFYDISKEQLIKIMDEVLTQLNQNSILVETQKVCYTYYFGSRK